jgi:hypothetical protein
MSDLLSSYLKPLAADYLSATNQKLKKEISCKVSNIVFILSYRKWELSKLTKLLAQFDYLSADEMYKKFENILGSGVFESIKPHLINNAHRAKGFAERNRYDEIRILSKWKLLEISNIEDMNLH